MRQCGCDVIMAKNKPTAKCYCEHKHERCGKRHSEEGSEVSCSRPLGHGGAHVACGVDDHKKAIWEFRSTTEYYLN